MSKAYSRVELDYLEAMMRQLGFTDQWIRLVMTCVRSVSFQVLLNGVPQGLISPTRGIQQGDQLSPYLFLLCTKGLSSLLLKHRLNGSLTGVSVSHRGYQLSHPFFADDSLLFGRATAGEWGNINQLLKQYELASGQKLNVSKTSIFYNLNTK